MRQDGPSDTWTREALYELVWSQPMIKLADRFGVSSSYMAPVCTLLNVPRPERGYWAKLAVGKAPERPALPAPHPGVATVALPLSVLLGSRMMPGLETQSAVIFAMIAAGVGMFTPNLVLSRLIDRRTKALRNGFPDALDLLVVCVESGLGLAAAIQRVADELDVSHPELAFELSTVNAEIRAGRPREQALRNLADRTGLPDIRGLVGLLVQTMRFGTGVSDALRVYSEEFRDKRMQRAEEQAAKMGTTLLFPLVLCMFPVFFIIAIGPAVLRILDWMADK